MRYLLNRPLPLPVHQPVVVSLNPRREIDPRHVVGSYEYAHPVFDLAARQSRFRGAWNSALSSWRAMIDDAATRQRWIPGP